MELNKFTQLLRRSTFDRNSVNTNINLTSNEQSKYFKKVNRILNHNLYSDKIEPRGRRPGGLDISHVESEKDYRNILTKGKFDTQNIDITKNKNILWHIRRILLDIIIVLFNITYRLLFSI